MSSRNFYSEIVADQNFAAMLDGNTYRWFDFQDLPAGSSKEYLVYFPNSETEVWFYGRSLSGRGEAIELNIYQDPVFTSEGTEMSDRIFNRNAKSSNTTGVRVWQDPAITSDGTLSDHDDVAGSTAAGNKGSAGSDASQDSPRVMPEDKYYLVRLTNNGTELGHFSYKLYWSDFN